MRLLYVVGTRPNFVKTAPVISALRTRFPDWRHALVHTGQHYDRAMSEIFFEELGTPEPDHMLGVGSGTHAEQTARVLERLEPVLRSERPDLVLVPGDVNSTLAAAICAARRDVPVAHIESGLRSFDRTMPEEINRVVADHLSSICFLHSDEAVENLTAEGVGEDRMRFVGNTMIDTLVALEDRFRARGAARGVGAEPGNYLLVTLHRPALVDGPLLADAMAALQRVGATLPVVFPVHPRTRKMLGGANHEGVSLIEPVGYLDFLSLEAEAAAVLTDSGGIQEETTYLGVPCFTLRDNTERPVTVRAGTNTLLGLDPSRIAEIPQRLGETSNPAPKAPEKWDGRASERVADVLAGW
ncbi:MAG TPA: UDP-N-acetylglucosamine 2-epimerase (non-hydrolyzing) [Solirubrobacterales bacterium]|jgi:UDP-N-acetylglucosamine 2-epimerase (non-hydrolysing)|nr:UDP-N-acetylglucosamine 2-epimerase (non-hydrolyzing) [Solirubrobacterales bacterium]